MSASLVTVAGFGFRSAAGVDSLRAALQAAMAQGAATRNISALATAADKAEAPAITQLAAELQLPIIAVPLAQLSSQPASPSRFVPARYGQRSLAEASALAAAGPGARLVVPRCLATGSLATAAIAESRNS
jgi:cobalt-precorrin 5A hydrolase